MELFAFGMRTSTWVAVLAFVVLALIRRDWRVLLAGWVWITGFETAFQLTSLVTHHNVNVDAVSKVALFTIIGLVTVPFFTVRGIRPSLPLMGVVLVIWVVWIATGFNVNEHNATSIDQVAEGLNEAAKSVWALAYLWPLARRSQVRAELRLQGADLLRE